MAGPLDGIKVVEITMFQQGPVAGMRLGDLGADVIKVEPKTGDPGRGMMRIVGADTGLKGRNYYFESNNRNKRSIVLDLRTEKGIEIFLKLIGISGIGPKLALNILSGIEASDLEDAIQRSDVVRISLIPGIGKKTALKIALELQEKLEKKEEVLKGRSSKEKEDLISALMNLGFKRKEVERVVDETIEVYSTEVDFEKLLRESLKRMAKV